MVALKMIRDSHLPTPRARRSHHAPLPHRHRYSLAHLMFSPDGQRLLIASGADAAFIHEFRKAELPIATLSLKAEAIAGQRIDSSAGMVEQDAATLDREWRALATKSP